MSRAGISTLVGVASSSHMSVDRICPTTGSCPVARLGTRIRPFRSAPSTIFASFAAYYLHMQFIYLLDYYRLLIYHIIKILNRLILLISCLT